MATWDAASIAALRCQVRMSQAEFARRLGIRQPTVSEWETGHYEPRGASIRVLSYLAEEPTPYDASPPREGPPE